MDYIIIVVKTFLYYILVAAIFRVMGKREVGQLGTFDLVVFVLIAELVAMGIEHKANFILHIIPVFLLVILQVSISKLSLKNTKFRNLMDGKPIAIIKNGVINIKDMVDQRYTLDDLLLQLREKDIRSLDEVEYAILENNGKLSVFKKGEDSTYPMPIILDGEIEYENLYNINKNKKWLYNILEKKKINLEDVFYAFNKKDELYIIKKSELKK